MPNSALLNRQQQEAVLENDHHCLVLAGAGSGKTRVIASKFLHLVEQKNVSPYSILCITFTNKAAREMAERIEQQYPNGGSLHIKTFHSFCSWFLRMFVESATTGIFSRQFSIVDAADSLKIIKDIVSKNSAQEEESYPKVVSKTISRLKNDFILSDHRVFPLPPYYWMSNLDEEEIMMFYTRYQLHLTNHNLMDFDDLLIYTFNILAKYDAARKYVQNKFKYLLVDEYQDTNKVQEKIIGALVELGLKVTVVGDEDQSIYSFRGSDIGNIEEFDQRYPHVKVIKLTQNYRSTHKILEVANSIISHNSRTHPKQLSSTRDGGKTPEIHTFLEHYQECHFVCQKITELKSRGFKNSDVAILYRTNNSSREIEQHLMRFGLPYQVLGGMKFYERKEIKDILAYLQTLLNPKDVNAFERILNYPKRGIGEKSKDAILTQIINRGDILSHLHNNDTLDGISQKVKKTLADMSTSLASLREGLASFSITGILNEILDRFGILKNLEAIKDSMEREKRMDSVGEFVSYAYDYEKRYPTHSFSDFMNHTLLQTGGDNEKDELDSIKLMSIHSSKGLEFPVVFIISVEEGVFPHHYSLKIEKDIEEERRLFYVAVTRCQDRLFISHSHLRRTFNEFKECIPSRFIGEIDENLIETWNHVIDRQEDSGEYF